MDYNSNSTKIQARSGKLFYKASRPNNYRHKACGWPKKAQQVIRQLGSKLLSTRPEKMECAGKGTNRRCLAPSTRRCARCGTVAYCSVSHQVLPQLYVHISYLSINYFYNYISFITSIIRKFNTRTHICFEYRDHIILGTLLSFCFIYFIFLYEWIYLLKLIASSFEFR